MKNIILIYPKNRVIFPDYPLGLNYLKSTIDKYIKDVYLFVIDLNVDILTTDQITLLYKPDILCVYANIVNSYAAIELCNDLKKIKNNMISIVGGPFPTTNPEKFLDDFDYVVRGEGETTIVNLINFILYKGDLNIISNITYKINNKIIHNAESNNLCDINNIPFPYRNNLYKYSSYRFDDKQIAPILSSRGCPFDCIFCAKEIFGYNVRLRTPDNILSEMNEIYEDYKISTFQFRDDIFTIDRNRILELCDKFLLNKYKFVWLCNTRIDYIDKFLIRRMFEAGCRRISFGIESGDQDILKYLNKNIKLDDIVEKCNYIKEIGIMIKFYIIVGVPGQSADSIEKTIDFLKLCKPDIVSCSIFLPLPGTQAIKNIHKDFEMTFDINNLKDWENAYYHMNYDLEHNFCPISTNIMMGEEIIFYRNKIMLLFNKYIN